MAGRAVPAHRPAEDAGRLLPAISRVTACPYGRALTGLLTVRAGGCATLGEHWWTALSFVLPAGSLFVAVSGFPGLGSALDRR
jgi:hypothetical protein